MTFYDGLAALWDPTVLCCCSVNITLPAPALLLIIYGFYLLEPGVLLSPGTPYRSEHTEARGLWKAFRRHQQACPEQERASIRRAVQRLAPLAAL